MDIIKKIEQEQLKPEVGEFHVGDNGVPTQFGDVVLLPVTDL